MLRKPLLSLFLAVLLGAVFFFGVVRLFVLRYEVGDVYPPYSSLRADPLGTKVLAAALEELPGVEVQRNFKPLPKLRPTGPVTLVYAGVNHHSYWSDQELLAFDALVANGSRAVFTFLPVESSPTAFEDKRDVESEHQKKKQKSKDEKSTKKKKADKKTESKKSEPDEESATEKEILIGFDAVSKRWGFDFGYLPEEKGKSYDRHAALVEPGGHLESDISWHSALYFRNLKPQWKVLYMCGTMPVVIERKYGDGTIVLMADSFLVSNEALRGERRPRLIARLFSGPSTIVFDEEHNDLRDDPGIASLARKYRLHGVVAGFVLLAIFFIWKNAVRFIPAYESSADEGDVIAGKESGEGFINLVRRAVRPAAVLDVCMTEWRKAFVHQPRELAKAEAIWAQEQARSPRGLDPIATYRAISRALVRKV